MGEKRVLAQYTREFKLEAVRQVGQVRPLQWWLRDAAGVGSSLSLNELPLSECLKKLDHDTTCPAFSGWPGRVVMGVRVLRAPRCWRGSYCGVSR